MEKQNKYQALHMITLRDETDRHRTGISSHYVLVAFLFDFESLRDSFLSPFLDIMIKSLCLVKVDNRLTLRFLSVGL